MSFPTESCVSCNGTTKSADLLKCGHSVCVRCLVTGSNEEVQCPKCTELTPLPSAGKSLADSYAVSVGDTDSQPSEQQANVVQHCGECVKVTEAVSKCAECKTLLCDVHALAHPLSHSTHEHRVETIELGLTGLMGNLDLRRSAKLPLLEEEAADDAKSSAEKDRTPSVVRKLEFPDANDLASSDAAGVLDTTSPDEKSVECSPVGLANGDEKSVECSPVGLANGDEKSVECSPVGLANGDEKSVECSPVGLANGDEKSVECSPVANGDGKCHGSPFQPAVAGKYQVTATLGDNHLTGSLVEVIAWKYSDELDNCLADRRPIPSLAKEEPRLECTPKKKTDRVSFVYFLLDPAISRNLPMRAVNDPLSDLVCLKQFIVSIFYVGKGKDYRPFDHFREAASDKPKKPKHDRINAIWKAGSGVVMFSCFHFTTSDEAHNREACCIDAIGLSNLTNIKPGAYFGDYAVQLEQSSRNDMGVYLLAKACRIFVQERERQYREDAVTPTKGSSAASTKNSRTSPWHRENSPHACPNCMYRGNTASGLARHKNRCPQRPAADAPEASGDETK